MSGGREGGCGVEVQVAGAAGRELFSQQVQGSGRLLEEVAGGWDDVAMGVALPGLQDAGVDIGRTEGRLGPQRVLVVLALVRGGRA